MQMSEEGKVRLMVIPVVAMLAVTVLVAGWQQEEEQVEIEVEEGYDEIVIPEEEQPVEEGSVATYPKNKSRVTTHVNNESYLEFDVEPRTVMRGMDVMNVRLKLSAQGHFEDELDVSTFKLRVSEKEESERPFNGAQFQTRYSQIDNGERWPPHEQQIGAGMVDPEHFAHEGYDLDSNEFTIETMLYWEIDSENIGEEFTLQLEAIVGGLSEDVTGTVLLHIEGGEG